MSDLGMPVGRVAAVALLSYFTLHAIWWNLEISETRSRLERMSVYCCEIWTVLTIEQDEIKTLENRIVEIEESQTQARQESASTASDPTPTVTSTARKWFWQS